MTSLFTDYLYLAHRLERQAAEQYCPQLSGVVVDAGSGNQPYRSLLNRSCHYVGVDPSPERSPDIVASLLDLPFSDDSCDSAMCTEVLEHVSDPWLAADELCRVLKPGGRLYLTVPQAWGLHYEPSDYFRFTKYGIAEILERAGFELEAVSPIGGLFSFMISRLVEGVFVRALFRLFAAVGVNRGRYRAAALSMAPLNAVAVPLAPLLDAMSPADPMGWAVLARKRQR